MNEKYFEGYIISLPEFLEKFIGIDTQLDVLQKATHRDIKFFRFENIKAVPFELVNKETIYTGEILLVKDVKNNLAAYLNPNRIKRKGKGKVLRNDKHKRE